MRFRLTEQFVEAFDWDCFAVWQAGLATAIILDIFLQYFQGPLDRIDGKSNRQQP